MKTKLNGQHFREQIKKFCDKKNINFSQLSKMAKINHSTIYTVFLREAESIQRSTAVKFAKGLNTDYEIIGDKIYFRGKNNNLSPGAMDIAKRYDALNEKDKIIIDQLLTRIE